MGVSLFKMAPDLCVSRLCLGTMTFGEQNSFTQSCEIMDEAFAAGINFFDTAEMYPVPQRASTQGDSERYIGRWLRARRIPRSRLVLASKVSGPSAKMTWLRGGPKYLDANNIKEAIDGSLLRLHTDYIDLYQIHWPDRYVPMFGQSEYNPTMQYQSIPLEEQLEALHSAVSTGKIRYIGVSNETPYGVMKFCHLAQVFQKYPRIISIQNAYNLLCRNFDAGLAECCHHERVHLLAYSPLAMGLLSGKYFDVDGGPPDARFNKFKGQYVEGESRYSLSRKNVVVACKEYLQIAEKYCINPVALAIAFVLKHPLVASVIFGVTKVSQLRDILMSGEAHLSADVLLEIDKVHETYPNPCP